MTGKTGCVAWRKLHHVMENLPFLLLTCRMDSPETRPFTQTHKHECICAYKDILTHYEEKMSGRKKNLRRFGKHSKNQLLRKQEITGEAVWIFTPQTFTYMSQSSFFF